MIKKSTSQKEAFLQLAALIYGSLPHHLDHLAPLCQLLEYPLFLTDEDLFSQARIFYPRLDVRLYSPHEVAIEILQKFDVILSCLSKTIVDPLFFFAKHTLQKPYLPIWCPHGNSDKGHKSGFMRFLSEEKALLLYGPRMLEFLEQLDVIRHLQGYGTLGNYRLKDYRIHQASYDHLAQQHITRKLPKAHRTILFAPSWNDSEGATSFATCETLIESLPLDTNLIIKLHPNTLIQEEQKIDRLTDRYEGHAHILFLPHYPHIYSLLALCDLYIGDVSSIGYDFLAFDKPMVFLNPLHLDRNTDPSVHLFQCGIVLTPEEYPKMYTLIEEMLPFDRQLFSPIRHELYHQTFGENRQPDEIGNEIRGLAQRIFDNSLDM